MAASLLDDEPPEPPADAEAFAEFVESLVLVEVATVLSNARRLGDGPLASTDLELETNLARLDQDIHLSYAIRAGLLDGEDDPIGNLEVEVVVIVRSELSEDAVTDEQITYFGLTNGPTIAMPFLRQAISAAAHAVGLETPTLPLSPTNSVGEVS